MTLSMLIDTKAHSTNLVFRLLSLSVNSRWKTCRLSWKMRINRRTVLIVNITILLNKFDIIASKYDKEDTDYYDYEPEEKQKPMSEINPKKIIQNNSSLFGRRSKK